MPLVVNVWSKVGVAVQTVLTPLTNPITAITKANPAVASSTAHGLSDGDVVKISASGMIEVNNMVVEVANVTANTFELKGIDSTLFNTFTSGSASEETFGAAAATITNVSQSGGEAKAIDITTVHDDTDREIPGNFTAINYTFDNIWDPADPALVELNKAGRVKGTRSVRLTFATGAKAYFDAYPSASLAPGGGKGEVVSTPAAFKLNGPITFYAS